MIKKIKNLVKKKGISVSISIPIDKAIDFVKKLFSKKKKDIR